MSKNYEELKFTDDFMFCKVLENNPNICKELLELFLDVKINKVVCVSKQKPIEITSDGKGIRLDVYIEDDNNSIYDIEMQTVLKKDLPKRSRYYHGMIDLNLIECGAMYRELKKSYVIFICLNDPFDRGLPLYHFSNKCRELPELSLNDEAFKVFINAQGNKADMSDDMKAFLQYFCNEKTYSSLVKKIDAEVEKARNHKEWRNEYMTLLMRDQEKREEGREEGFVLAASIIDYLTNHPSEKAEEIAEKLSCSVEQVMQIRNLLKQ